MNDLGIRQKSEDWGKPFMWRGWDHFHSWCAGGEKRKAITGMDAAQGGAVVDGQRMVLTAQSI